MGGSKSLSLQADPSHPVLNTLSAIWPHMLESCTSLGLERTWKITKGTRLPGAVPQPIGWFLFGIEFGWG